MKFKLIAVSIGIIIPMLTLNSYAQTAEDALLFSNTAVNGSARFQGMAGAQTALGADISSIAGNPAGLGFFRKSEWSISPSLSFANTNATYPLGNSTTDGKSNLNIANMGIVFSAIKDDIIPGNWRGGSFGISFSRMNSYQNRFSYEGVNNVNSLTDAFTSQADGISLNAFENGDVPPRLLLAYRTYLINPFTNDPNEDRYFSSVVENAPVNQSETIDYTGARSQWNFSYGGNYADKFYFGASLGISRIRYSFADTYRETVLANVDELILDNFTLSEDVDVRGTGINLSAGVIYKPNDMVRFGASIVTPTYYRLSDDFTPQIQASYEYTESLGQNVPLDMTETINDIETFQYNLTTPMNASAGVAVFAGKNGFISADVTYTAFNSIQFRSNNSDDFRETNRYIQNNFQPTVTARLGGEYRKDIFRLRAGFAYQGDAYKDMIDDLDRTRLNFTAGAGIRLPEFYIDLAVVHSRFNSGFTPYTIVNQSTPSVTIKNAFTNAIVSFGMFF